MAAGDQRRADRDQQKAADHRAVEFGIWREAAPHHRDERHNLERVECREQSGGNKLVPRREVGEQVPGTPSAEHRGALPGRTAQQGGGGQAVGEPDASNAPRGVDQLDAEPRKQEYRDADEDRADDLPLVDRLDSKRRQPVAHERSEAARMATQAGKR